MNSLESEALPPRRTWNARVRSLLWLAPLLLGAFCLWRALPGSVREPVTAHAAVRSAHREPVLPASSPRELLTAPIGEIRTGMRVMAHNPLAPDGAPASVDEFDESPVPAEHRNIVFRMKKRSGDQIDFELIRHVEWLDGAAVGDEVDLDLFEFGAEGRANILAIQPCPPIEQGKGSVVTGRFVHTAQRLLNVNVTGLTDPLGCTDSHPFWSEDRQDFVAAGELHIGENLRSLSGNITKVTSIVPRAGPVTVYNLEVAGEHVYYVGQNGTLVHNSCPNPWGMRGSPRHQAKVKEVEALMKRKGWDLKGGGSKPELSYSRRRPDLVFEKNGQLIAVQVGRRNVGNRLPVARERRALQDLRSLWVSDEDGVRQLFSNVFFVEY